MNIIDNDLNYILAPLRYPIIDSALKALLVVYSGLLVDKLPDSVLKVLTSTPVKILILFIIIWSSNHNPTMAILIAVGLFVSINLMSNRQPFESFKVPSTHTTSVWGPHTVEHTTTPIIKHAKIKTGNGRWSTP